MHPIADMSNPGKAFGGGQQTSKNPIQNPSSKRQISLVCQQQNESESTLNTAGTKSS